MNCKLGAARLIDEMIVTLRQIDMKDYSRPLEVYNQSTLGKHFRHIYDFFNCLIVQSDKSDVDYCLRNRDVRLEDDLEFSIAQFEELKRRLAGMDESKSLQVHADFEIEKGVRPVVSTTIGRELMYAYDHAVHHLAIVKIGLRELYPQSNFNQELGVAASTIRYQNATS